MRNIKTLLFLTCLLSSTLSYSQITLPRLISDGMILQRDASTKIWGWAAPGEKVSLTFDNRTYTAVTDKDKNWKITLPPQQAGGPYEMTLVASNKITVKDILFGDVWLCSGQSNMELTMERVQDEYAKVIASANNPNIRQFEVPDRYNFKAPNSDLDAGKWVSVNPQDILKFSAVAYFFANDLYTEYKVPIGLINSALGGSPAEAWISEDALRKFPQHFEELQKYKDPKLITQTENSNARIYSTWYNSLNQTDEGLKQQWQSADLQDAEWSSMQVPGYWENSSLGKVNGAVWFRKEVIVPDNLVGKQAKLLLGRIVDADSVFINGEFVGTTSYQYPPRKYPVAANVLKRGKNIIAVRVMNESGAGGFVPDKPYKLVIGTDSLELAGQWKYRLGTSIAPMAAQTTVRWKPTGLYNAMIAPLLNYPIKGVIWYQGESNTKNPAEYASLMETLIQDWRTRWKQGDFPFIMVQLANFMETSEEPSESNWAALRQAQLNTLRVSNTGLAVAIDAGEWNDIHPLNKQVVGKRLALQAMKLAYGEKKITASGPTFKSIERKGNKLILSFDNVGSGLVTLNRSELKHFAIAGEDKKFVWANAKIQGNKVIVWHESVAKPTKVRYAWADNPQGANLYNKELLPASPFEAAIQTK